MNHLQHRKRARRWVLPGLIAALLAVLLTAAPVSHAATAVIRDLHMADHETAGSPAVVHFPGGVTTVYFDYRVTFISSERGTVQVYRGGTSGPVVGQSDLIFAVAAPLSTPLSPTAGGPWPDGGYCSVLLIDGVPDTTNKPVSWSVGNASAPTCPTPQSSGTPVATSPPTNTPLPGSNTATPTPTATATAAASGLLRFRVNSHSTLRAGHSGNVRVTVQDATGPVSGATITINGRSAGIASLLKGKTGAKGVATFHHVKPTKAGKLSIAATKQGYRKSTFALLVGG